MGSREQMRLLLWPSVVARRRPALLVRACGHRTRLRRVVGGRGRLIMTQLRCPAGAAIVASLPGRIEWTTMGMLPPPWGRGQQTRLPCCALAPPLSAEATRAGLPVLCLGSRAVLWRCTLTQAACVTALLRPSPPRWRTRGMLTERAVRRRCRWACRKLRRPRDPGGKGRRHRRLRTGAAKPVAAPSTLCLASIRALALWRHVGALAPTSPAKSIAAVRASGGRLSTPVCLRLPHPPSPPQRGHLWTQWWSTRRRRSQVAATASR